MCRRVHVTVVALKMHEVFNILSENVGLFTKHAKRMRGVTLLSLFCNENWSIGSRIVPCGWTDGQRDGRDEANSRFTQFCECA
jgi:hypothetical protein